MLNNVEDNEFDIQKTILKKKSVKSSKFFVEYDKLTNQVLKITPEHIETENPRCDILVVDENDLIREVFTNKISLHKLKVRYDYESNTRTVVKHYQKHRWEFDYIKTDNDPENFIHLYCDFVSKKIVANFIDKNFLKDYTKERTTELQLSNLPDWLDVYCIQKHDPSKLYGTMSLNLKKLFTDQEQSFQCSWLPDDESYFNDLTFLHYNHDIKLTVDKEPIYVPIVSAAYKPTMVYKQSEDILQLQSIIEEAENFRLGENITFYLYDANDPSVILDTVSLNTESLNNFNMIELKLKNNTPVKVISNYSHLHIEDANVSTYYKF